MDFCFSQILSQKGGLKKFSTWLLDVFFGKTAYPQVRRNRNKTHQEGFPQLHSDSYTTPDPSGAFFGTPRGNNNPNQSATTPFVGWFFGQARCQLFFCTLPKVEPLEPENGPFPSTESSRFVRGIWFFRWSIRLKNFSGGGVGRLWRTSRHPRWCDRKVCNVRNFLKLVKWQFLDNFLGRDIGTPKSHHALEKQPVNVPPILGAVFSPFKTRSFSKQNKVHQRVLGTGSFRVEHLRLYVRLHVIQIALKSFLVWCPKQNCLPQIPPPPPLDTTCRRSNRVRQAKWTALQGPSQDKSYQDLLQLLWPLVTWSMSLLMQAAHW